VLALAAAALSAVLLPACSAEQAYRSGQGWQRHQCDRMPDRAEAERCMARASTGYDDYKKQSGSDAK
jgi:hypothetical protein